MDRIPALSIVVPTRNTRELTLACLASIPRAADGLTLEVVVVDDGSTDSTVEAIRRSHPDVALVATAGGTGFTKAANLGLRTARGSLLLLLNSDTELTAGGLPHLEQAFTRNPRLGIAGARLLYPDGRPQWSGGGRPDGLWLFALASGLANPLRRFPGYGRLRRSRDKGTVDWVSGAALALRREVWETIGPLDEAFRFYAQDLDLCLRAKASGWEVEVLPDFRVIHHHGSTIRKDRDAADLNFQPPILWADLVRWAGKDGGAGQAQSSARLLRWGTRLRLLGRSLRAPFTADRPRFQAESEAFRAALAVLLHPSPDAG